MYPNLHELRSRLATVDHGRQTNIALLERQFSASSFVATFSGPAVWLFENLPSAGKEKKKNYGGELNRAPAMATRVWVLMVGEWGVVQWACPINQHSIG